MENVQIAQLVIAAYLVVMGSVLNTTNFASAVVFKIIPLISAFVLGLIAFNIIK